MRQLELRQTPPKRKVQTLFPKRPVMKNAVNLTIVTEEATNQPTPTPLMAFRKPFQNFQNEIEEELKDERAMDVDM